MYQTQVDADSNNSFSWLSLTVTPGLKRDEVHVWLARLGEEKAAPLEPFLSPDEQARVKRFRFERDKKQFIVGRGLLRVILGKYLKAKPEQICFEYNKFGKPSIASDSHADIKFNLSHSDGLALYAFARNREIGVDLERIKSSLIEDGMLAQFLTSQEKACFKRLAENEKNRFFFECWTRKEAYLKARGNGLSLPANQIEISAVSKSPAKIIDKISEFRQPRFYFQNLPPIPGYAAALAVEGNDPRFKFLIQE